MDSYPSSSSFPSLASKIKFDVFLSFRGNDTRQGFVSHLCKALCHKKIETFIDYKLREGDEISPTLLRAIEQSRISLIIFSQDYASSRWCLEELEKIIECKTRNGQIVVPIFHKIQPSDVRSQKGSFGNAFAQLQESFKSHMSKVEKWREAMKEAANLSGFPSSNYETEADLIETIVKRVTLRLDHMCKIDLQHFIGIDEHIVCVEYMMCRGLEDVRLIGIWGMGGIGKTTIAAVMFNRLSSEYEGCCFLQVREEMEKYGITHLQNKLFSFLLEDDLNLISTPSILPPNRIWRLCRKKVLVVLDDVNDSEQLRNLVGGLDWYGPGSRIIVTTRNKQVFGKEDGYIYLMRPLSFDKAIQLFNLNAFKQNCVDMELIELTRKFVDYAQGIPLALKVLGFFLYNKSKEEWESQWKKLRNMPFLEIQSVLRLSYDGLDREEKNILKYIACAFQFGGSKIDMIKVVLDSYGYSTPIGLKNLQDKALIAVAQDVIYMHHLIKEMIREIIREESINDPGKRSHLWDPDEIYKLLKNDKGTDAIQSISLDLSQVKKLSLPSHAFNKMPDLKLLQFYTREMEGSNLDAPQGLESLPEGLRIFGWEGCPLPSLPITCCAENVVEIRMPGSKIEKLWDGIQEIVNLRIIDLSRCRHLIELPDCSKASNLREVNLELCVALRHVHPSILSQHKLQHLLMNGCKALKCLQSDVHLPSLHALYASNCSSLKEFSMTSETLKYLALANTVMEELPSSVGQLSRLEYLNLRGSKFKNLSNDLACLRSLRKLDLSKIALVNTSTLYVLFDNGLRSLQKLNLNRCCNLYELPDNISLLSSLTELSLKHGNIKSLPSTIKHLSRLRSLCLRDCKRLQSLLELPPCIKYLNASECTSLMTVSIFMSELLNPQRICDCNPQFMYSFENCMKLNEQALGNIIAYAEFRKQIVFKQLDTSKGKSCPEEVQVFLPGSNVPNWINHRTTEATIAIKLSPHLMGFTLCYIVSQYTRCKFWRTGYKCCLEANNGERVEYTRSSGAIFQHELNSDHVYIWYDVHMMKEIKERSRPNAVCTPTSYLMATLELFLDTTPFSLPGFDTCTFNIEIKEWGIYPIYASEYMNFIEPIKNRGTKTKMAQDVVVYEPSNTRIGVSNSFDEKEPHFRPKKLKGSIFQSCPSETKDIDEVEPTAIETGAESFAYENEDDLELTSSNSAEGRKTRSE